MGDKRRRAAILALLSTTQLIGVLDFSIVNIALPSIQREFHLAVEQLQWLVSAYGLTLGGFLLLGGRISDLYDRKTVFLGALILFTPASLAGGLAPPRPLLIGARAVQGLAGAFLAPAALALVAQEFAAGPERNRALAVFGTLAAVGFTVGVILGGVLTGFAGWRWVFFVNVPIGMAAVIVAAYLLEAQGSPAGRHRLDLGGALLVTAGMLAVVAALTELAVPTTVRFVQAGVLLALAATLLAAFVIVERTSPDPILPLRVFRLPLLRNANLVAVLSILVASVLAFSLTLFVQRTLGLSPQRTSLAFLPAGLGGMVGGLLAGRVVRRIGIRWTTVSTLIVLASGTGLLLGPGLDGSAGWIAIGYGVAAVGIVGTAVATTIAAMSHIDRTWQGVAAGLLSTSQQIGGAMGAAAAGVLVASGSVGSFRWSLVLALAVVGVATIAAGGGFRANSPYDAAHGMRGD